MTGTAFETGGGKYRWRLDRVWRPSSDGHVCWIMLNPSTANGEQDDPTLRDITARSSLWGYGGLVVVNLYPFRTRYPTELRRWADWEATSDWHVRDQIHHNAELVGVEARKARTVIVAWGACDWAQEWADFVTVEHLRSGEDPCPELFCIGVNADGSPKHPLARGRGRVPREQQPIPWTEHA